jgi:hypothetical protein
MASQGAEPPAERESNPYEPPRAESIGPPSRQSPIARERRMFQVGGVWGMVVGAAGGGLAGWELIVPGALVGLGVGAAVGYFVAKWTHPRPRPRAEWDPTEFPE